MDTLSAGSALAPTARYDRITIAFHWAVAVLVLLLFASMVMAGYVPREWHWRRPLETFHVSIGILFAAVIIGRLIWRWSAGRKLPAAEGGLPGLAAKMVHLALYLLLVLQTGLGFGLRWMQGEAFSFFGLFDVPQIFAPNPDLAHAIEDLHNYTAWTIVILAAGHAVAALGHHFITGDGVLRRMLPGRNR